MCSGLVGNGNYYACSKSPLTFAIGYTSEAEAGGGGMSCLKELRLHNEFVCKRHRVYRIFKFTDQAARTHVS